MKSRDFPGPPNLIWFKISAFPAALEEESLPYRYATFSISVESSPLALHPGLYGVRGVLLGSVATQLLHLAGVPATLVN